MVSSDNGRNLDTVKSIMLGVKYFQNAATKTLRQNLYVMSVKYSLKWLKTALKDAYLRRTTSTTLQTEVSKCHKCIMIGRLRLWSISQ